jgi:hypothetical protein
LVFFLGLKEGRHDEVEFLAVFEDSSGFWLSNKWSTAEMEENSVRFDGKNCIFFRRNSIITSRLTPKPRKISRSKLEGFSLLFLFGPVHNQYLIS